MMTPHREQAYGRNTCILKAAHYGCESAAQLTNFFCDRLKEKHGMHVSRNMACMFLETWHACFSRLDFGAVFALISLVEENPLKRAEP
jgi:hypothetical protein